jgi:hypothetical protein
LGSETILKLKNLQYCTKKGDHRAMGWSPKAVSGDNLIAAAFISAHIGATIPDKMIY